MDNIFYVDYKELDSIQSTKAPIGVIINMKEFGTKELDILIKKMHSDKEKHLINKIIIRMEGNAEILNTLKASNDIYYQFTNEDDIRELIYNMQDNELKDRILGNNFCKTGIDILKYRAIGISNIIVTAPIINSRNQLDMLEKIGYTLFVVPNHMEDFLRASDDPSWIRPEGIKFYPNIKNWILDTYNLNPNTVFNAYTNEIWLGKLSSIIINFENINNEYADIKNFLIPTFDIKRTTCNGNCLSCQKCEKEFIVNKLFTEKKGEEE